MSIVRRRTDGETCKIQRLYEGGDQDGVVKGDVEMVREGCDEARKAYCSEAESLRGSKLVAEMDCSQSFTTATRLRTEGAYTFDQEVVLWAELSCEKNQ